MEFGSTNRVSGALAAWLSRRKVVKGLTAIIGSGAVARELAEAQDVVSPSPTTEVNAINNQAVQTDLTTEVFQPTDPHPPNPTETLWPTDPPNPTETPWVTETFTPTETPTETPPATETPSEIPTEQAPAPAQEPVPALDDSRRRIAAICREAANVLAEDMAEPSAFDKHPHPEDAFGFLQMLNDVALWGTNAEMWDDAMLASYVVAADACALAVRVGADAYYEVFKDSFPPGAFPGDPDTCIFRELAKWRDCIEGCAPDDAVCRLTCFWEFTVLHSCRRCLRGF